MANDFYRSGFAEVCKNAGYMVSSAKYPGDINTATHKQDSYLILGESRDVPLSDLVLRCIERVECIAVMVIVHEIKVFEVRRLKSLGVTAILSDKMPLNVLVGALALLPGHWIMNTEVIIPEGVSMGDESLSEREWQVCSMLANGCSVKEIASRYGLSTKTVEAHKFNLMRKLDIHRSIELSYWFRNNGHLWETSFDGLP